MYALLLVMILLTGCKTPMATKECCYGREMPNNMQCPPEAYIDCDDGVCTHYANCENLIPLNQEK